MTTRGRSTNALSWLVFGLLTASSCMSAQTPSGTFTTVYKFKGAPSDGGHPTNLSGSGSVLYATTTEGGSAQRGAICSLTAPANPGSPWTETVLYSFTGGPQGHTPSGLVVSSGGVLYGFAQGGTFGYGVAYSLAPPASHGEPWTYSSLFEFNSRIVTAAPPVIASGGVLYGIGLTGGSSNEGLVFSLTPPVAKGSPWVFTQIYSFLGGGGGEQPTGLRLGPAGVLYGTASGTDSNMGYVFSLNPPSSIGGQWTYAILATLAGYPAGGVALGSGGLLFGTTSNGGGWNEGMAFSLTPPVGEGSWTLNILYAFTGLSDGGEPSSPLTIGPAGVLYGVTPYGGNTDDGRNPGAGTIFSLTPPLQPGGSWTESAVYAFTGAADGSYPTSPVLTKKGMLYGVAEESGGGSVFGFAP